MYIVLNGTQLKVEKVEFDKFDYMDDAFYHDCYITFLDGEVARYDASDIVVVG